MDSLILRWIICIIIYLFCYVYVIYIIKKRETPMTYLSSVDATEHYFVRIFV